MLNFNFLWDQWGGKDQTTDHYAVKVLTTLQKLTLVNVQGVRRRHIKGLIYIYKMHPEKRFETSQFQELEDFY